jgi:flagellar basal body rod protein FlgG
VVDSLRIVKVADEGALTAVGNGLYMANAPLTNATGFVVYQGAQERPNVDMTADMVRMMEVSRHIESMQRAIVAYDGVLNSGINQLGKE